MQYIEKKKFIKINLKILCIIIFLIGLIWHILFKLKQINSTKVCICTIGKKENLYIREFLNFYRNYGVDKIFLYDNNDINNEKFEDVILDFINDGFVEIINFRGILGAHYIAQQDCYKKNYQNYNWLIFYDIDEFIHLRNFNNIKKYLIRKRFNKCEIIQLNWIFHTDNNLLYYDNRSLFKRFPKIEKKAKERKKGVKMGIKSILRGNIKTIIYDIHFLNSSLISCDGFGNIRFLNKFYTNITDFRFNYIDHFYTKSTNEFINKITRGSATRGFDEKFKIERIRNYFILNDISLEKINIFKNRTKYNLSNIILKKNN